MILLLVVYLTGLGTPDPPYYKTDMFRAPTMEACEQAKAEIEQVEQPVGQAVVVFCINTETV